MMKLVSYSVLCAALLLASTSTRLIAAVPLSPIPGYVCMGLNITNAQAHDFNFEVPIRSEPNSRSQVLQTAALVSWRCGRRGTKSRGLSNFLQLSSFQAGLKPVTSGHAPHR